MAEIVHYYFDPATSQYRRVQATKWDRVVIGSRFTALAAGFAVIMVFAYSSYFEMPDELALKAELTAVQSDYKKLDAEIAALQKVISTVETRDDNVYRRVLGAEPMDKGIREGGIGGSDRFGDVRERSEFGGIIAGMYAKIAKLRRKSYIELMSQDELVRLAEDKKDLYSSIPAIQPLANPHLTALASGFGMRMHPVYRVVKMHTGIDFSSPVGTPVYATADGQVIAVDTAVRGYGKMVIIDHGHGYQTRYAHLHDFKVWKGEHVKRGYPIAHSGNTGVSTAPHLHYEVLLNGVQIDPIHYFFGDLSAVEYDRIVALASVPNTSLGN